MAIHIASRKKLTGVHAMEEVAEPRAGGREAAWSRRHRQVDSANFSARWKEFLNNRRGALRKQNRYGLVEERPTARPLGAGSDPPPRRDGLENVRERWSLTELV